MAATSRVLTPRSRVAVIVKNYPIQRSISILLMLDLLRRLGCEVVLVVENAGVLPEDAQKGLSVCQVPRSRVGKARTLLRLMTLGCFDWALAFDPHAFHLAAKFIPLRRIVYYSLELYL